MGDIYDGYDEFLERQKRNLIKGTISSALRPVKIRAAFAPDFSCSQMVYNATFNYSSFSDENGNLKIIIDIPGFGKENIEITTRKEQGKHGIINIDAKRELNIDKKMKLFEGEGLINTFKEKIYLSYKYDLDSLVVKCENGQLILDIAMNKTSAPETKKVTVL